MTIDYPTALKEALYIGDYTSSFGELIKVYYHKKRGYTWGQCSMWFKPNLMKSTFIEPSLKLLTERHQKLIRI